MYDLGLIPTREYLEALNVAVRMGSVRRKTRFGCRSIGRFFGRRALTDKVRKSLWFRYFSKLSVINRTFQYSLGLDFLCLGVSCLLTASRNSGGGGKVGVVEGGVSTVGVVEGGIMHSLEGSERCGWT